MYVMVINVPLHYFPYCYPSMQICMQSNRNITLLISKYFFLHDHKFASYKCMLCCRPRRSIREGYGLSVTSTLDLCPDPVNLYAHIEILHMQLYWSMCLNYVYYCIYLQIRALNTVYLFYINVHLNYVLKRLSSAACLNVCYVWLIFQL